MKKLILLILLGACFNNKTTPKNNKDEDRKSQEDKNKDNLTIEEDKNNLPSGIIPVTLEDGKTYQVVFTAEKIEELKKEGGLQYLLYESKLQKETTNFEEIREKIRNHVSNKLETAQRNKESIINFTNFLNEVKNIKTREELKELIFKYDISKMRDNNHFQSFIITIKNLEIFQYSTSLSEGENKSNFSYFILKGRLNEDRKFATLHDVETRPGDEKEAIKMNEVSLIEKIENGIYYIFNVPIQLKEIAPLPNEKIVNLRERSRENFGNHSSLENENREEAGNENSKVNPVVLFLKNEFKVVFEKKKTKTEDFITFFKQNACHGASSSMIEELKEVNTERDVEKIIEKYMINSHGQVIFTFHSENTSNEDKDNIIGEIEEENHSDEENKENLNN